jgi:hypothetical protein
MDLKSTSINSPQGQAKHFSILSVLIVRLARLSAISLPRIDSMIGYISVLSYKNEHSGLKHLN